jgi:hypothetical protein
MVGPPHRVRHYVFILDGVMYAVESTRNTTYAAYLCCEDGREAKISSTDFDGIREGLAALRKKDDATRPHSEGPA